MSIKDWGEGDLESITAIVSYMEDDTMKTNQNAGVLKIAVDEATESINGDKIKRSRKLTEKGLQYKLEQQCRTYYQQRCQHYSHHQK